MYLGQMPETDPCRFDKLVQYVAKTSSRNANSPEMLVVRVVGSFLYFSTLKIQPSPEKSNEVFQKECLVNDKR
jgi:hypothetical protein